MARALPRRALEQVAALFMHGEHRALAGDTWHRRSDDRAALVEDQLEFNALFFKILQRQRDAVAADLLIVGGGEPQVAGRLEALPQQLLKSRKFREQRRFRIHCAAAPELTVRDLRGKWRVLPLPRARDHVVVGHHHHIAALVFAGQLVDPAVVAERHKLRLFMEERKQFPHGVAQFFKFRIVKAFAAGNRFAADHLGQPLRMLRKLCFAVIIGLRREPAPALFGAHGIKR